MSTPDAVNQSPVVGPRKPWVAGVLSVLMLGLGHIYAGRGNRAVNIWVLTRLLLLGIVYLISIGPGSLILSLPLVWLFGVTGVVAWDAVQCVRRDAPAFVARWYNRWYAYVIIVCVDAFLLQPQYLKPIRARLDAFKIVSPSMRPGILPGDFFFATRLDRPPARGEIVVCHVRGENYVKRVVGVPGDTVSMQAGTLFVDGRAVAEPYAMRLSHDETQSPDFQWQARYLVGNSAALYRPTQATWGPLVVPRRSYFVLGDNRDDSYDSRYTGFVVGDSIRMRPRALYFSLDPDTKLPRWGRIGRSIQ